MTTGDAGNGILEWGVGEARPKGPTAGMGFLGREQPALPQQPGGLWERCKLPQRGPGRSPGRRRVFRLDALAKALSVIATATWLGGWLAGRLGVCHSRYCIKTTKPIRKLFGPSGRPII